MSISQQKNKKFVATSNKTSKSMNASLRKGTLEKKKKAEG